MLVCEKVIKMNAVVKYAKTKYIFLNMIILEKKALTKSLLLKY